MKINRLETLTIGCLSFLCYFLVGAYIDIYRGFLSRDAISRLVSAWLVFHGTEVKFASIGFVWPPLPTLLLIPLTFIPTLVQNWLAVVVLSALSMSIACMVLAHLAALCGIPTWWRSLIVLSFAINPWIIIFGINGMSEAILIAATITACYWLVHFWQTNKDTHLIFTAGLFGLLPLIRYEFALVSAWSGLLILLLSWEKRHLFSRERFGQFLEGRLLAYSSLVIYPIFLWAIANWFIMGSPAYFLSNDRTALNVSDFQLSDAGIITTPQNSFNIAFGAWFWAFPLGLIGSLALILLGWRKKSSFYIGFGLMPLIIPFLQFFLLTRRQNIPLLRYFVMVVPLGVVVLLVFILMILPTLKSRRWGVPLLSITSIVLLLGSNVLTVRQLNTYPYQDSEDITWSALTGKGDSREIQYRQAYDLGRLLANTIPANSKVLMDTFGGGSAVLLGAGDHSIFMDFTDPNYTKALLDPPAYVDYILVPNPVGLSSFYLVNQYQKTLYAKGAPWAQLVDSLPTTIDGWKLYKVKRSAVNP